MNNAIFYFFYSLAHQSPYLDTLIVFLAVYLPYVVVMLAGLFLLFHHGVFRAENPYRVFLQKKKEILLAFFTGAVAWILAHFLKFLFHTGRPFNLLLDVHSLFSETGYAFPSGHATFFMALAFSIFLLHKKSGYIFMLFALFISLARIAGGVHFPIDILGGFTLGVLVALLVSRITKFLRRRKYARSFQKASLDPEIKEMNKF